MSKVLTFSRVFPSYHPRKGEPTYFVEAMLTQLGIDYTKHDYFIWLVENNPDIDEWFLNEFYERLSHDIDPKSHTIRAHKKPLKVGEWINPKCWAGRPYNKTKEGYWQIKFAPDIEVKKVWDFEVFIDIKSGYDCVRLNGVLLHEFDGNEFFMGGHLKLRTIAKNDGLEFEAFGNWFNKTMKGQIICWNENIEY
jgi:hypothetical protein